MQGVSNTLLLRLAHYQSLSLQFRKLFARTFYGIEEDVAKLADILGHSSINTTRIYTKRTSTEHRRKIERLGRVV